MMTKLRKAVEGLVDMELVLASEQHGERFRSAHEAYAVILEEFEEAVDEISHIRENLFGLWNTTKSNDYNGGEYSLDNIMSAAESAACECIQVAAMAEKALRGYEVNDEN